ncbi:MAG: VIT1/CCC1 transporter family protein [Patescibacteria group bacterium]
MKHLPRDDSFIRNFVFGVEDSLVSTVGLLSGIVFAGVSRTDVIITGVILIFVEGFSMGVGSFLSEWSAEEYVLQHETNFRKSAKSAFVMLISYLVAGFIPLFPYFFVGGNKAIFISIPISLVTLFFLGIGSGRFSKVNTLKDGLRMLIIGGLAIVIGVVVGKLVGYNSQ